MLSLRAQLFACTALLLFLVWLVYLVRYKSLSIRDSLYWFLSTLLALVFTAFPQALRGVAHALQIEIPANALFALAFLYVLANLLWITVNMSDGAVRIRRLTQEAAVLRAEVDRLKAQVDRSEPGAGRPPR